MAFRVTQRASVPYRLVEAVSDWIGHRPVIGSRWAAFWYNRLMRIPWIKAGWLVEGKREISKLRSTHGIPKI